MCVLIIDVLKYLVWKNKCYENQIWFKCYLSSVHEEKFHNAGCYSHLEDAIIETESSCPSAPHQISTTDLF